MFNDARITDLRVPTASGRYYLADAGFPNSLSLMLPYRGVRYHLMEWSRADLRYCISFLYSIIVFLPICNRPATAHELFNLRHASACNIVEHIFGILKNRFAILRSNPNLDMDTQARIAPALAAIHNVIREYDANEIDELLNDNDDATGAIEPSEDTGDLAEGPARNTERQEADARRDIIADQMW
jgi:hypothetical protein